MRVLQINTTYNIGSTGRIVSGIDSILKVKGIESYVGYGYGNIVDNYHYKIVDRFESYLHNAMSRFSDGQGLFTNSKTSQFVKRIEEISPDIIHLHNLHGNYINYRLLFNYIIESNSKVVWTLHDCWPFTGHCAYFDMVGCEKWQNQCEHCPQTKCYPPSFVDCSKRNFILKKHLFTALGDRLVIVPVSYWLSRLLKDSFFSNCNIVTIHNGINLVNFKHYEINPAKPYVLGVAAQWDKRKGLSDFIKLRSIIDKNIGIVLVGLSKTQIRSLPKGINGIERTNNVEELSKLYSGASVFVNTTYEDNYPTVNLESISCGTPVITYNTGGSPESVLEGCGLVVPRGDVIKLCEAINKLITMNVSRDQLIRISRNNFDEKNCFQSYLELYKSIM